MELSIGEDGIPFVPLEEFAQLSLTEIDQLRRATPVVRTHPMRLTVLRADDVKRLSGHPSLIQVPGTQYCQAMEIPEGRCRSFLETFMLMTNGHEHQHRRGAFARVFAHPVIRQKREQVRAVADQIIADLPRGEPFDFLDLCASRLPAEMIAEVLGLQADDSRWFAKQVYSLSRCLVAPYQGHEEVEAAAEALFGFVQDTLEERSQQPRDDLISMLVSDDSDRGLERQELIYQVMGVILGGSDTTRSGFNVTVGRLLADRDVWNEILADRSLIPGAIEEVLRIEPPVGSMPRFAPAAIEVSGMEIPAGQLVNLSSLSAMRDGSDLSAPQILDIRRTDGARPHLVFGGGAHRCLGEMLARLELEEGLAALMDGAPEIELIEAPKMPGAVGLRQSSPLIARIP